MSAVVTIVAIATATTVGSVMLGRGVAWLLPSPTGYPLCEQRLRDLEADRSRSETKAGAVHADPMTQTGARHHVR